MTIQRRRPQLRLQRQSALPRRRQMLSDAMPENCHRMSSIVDRV